MINPLLHRLRTALVVSIDQSTFFPRRLAFIVQKPGASLASWCTRIELVQKGVITASLHGSLLQ